MYLYMPFEEVAFTEEYDDVEDVVDRIVEQTAEAQDMTEEGLREDGVIPITAIDEAEMPRALANPNNVSQETWDALRAFLRTEVEARGYTVD